MDETAIKPSPDLVESSYVKDYEKLYAESVAQPEAFWENIAKELSWFKPWDTVLDWQYPYAHWFKGAKCNIVNNALDRHLKTATKDKMALVWEGQDGGVRTFTYQQLNDEVCKLANALKTLGIKKGDRVSIYLPRLPEQTISMLACAKIGAVHTVVYSGFSTDAMKNRVTEAESKVVITADGYHFREKLIDTKKTVDNAVKDCPSVQKMIIVKRTGNPVEMVEGRDLWWDDVLAKQDSICSTEIMDAEDPLFILYTSGSTGKPKGIVHSHGGYMVGIYITLKWIFNLQPTDVYWCTADPGWITGHSYIVYAPLINGITNFIYEGPPDFPDPGKWWSLLSKYKVSKFYTTPTAIRALMKYGEEWPNKFDFSNVKILGSVGEPINPEAWKWYHRVIGGGRCPIMDTWWQTETGMHILSPLPSVVLKPGSAFKPFPGLELDVVDHDGQPVERNKQGFLIIKKPWPAMMKDIYKNEEKYRKSYWEEIPNVYFTGDTAKIDEDGYFWILGRNDDVLKVSGYRFGSAELESAFVAHPSVAEAAVIGKPHEVKGESIKAFIILKVGQQPTDELKAELKKKVREMIGPIATPDEIEFVTSLPKTRSGKIMRRVLKAQELGQPLGDTSTLEN
ncbi:acetate--CoA ligase [Candidatus Woesebacteria bacterium]|jgi:acetyl-CoA synthetase|nr:acetate--CoA ligase [Candidatus Woesebacteria bacterium]MBP6883115.1 acetate--CoA ligase [Candidatus Woesebacteria bacterium]